MTGTRTTPTLDLGNESTARFLRAIAAHLDPSLVEELHFFPSIRQGGKESGVAVIAARHAEPPTPAPEGGEPPDAPDDSWLTTDSPLKEDSDEEVHPGPQDPGVGDGGEPRDHVATHVRARPRLTVYRASYRWTLKGVDRGKWEIDVVAEADAPMTTIDEVVRGVTRRSGDTNEPDRVTGDEFRAALASAELR